VVTPALTALTLRRSRWAQARWLVLAPHPDDETLGTGALIADAAARDALAGVVFVTDGAGSHPHETVASRSRLVATRRHEAKVALRRLAGARNSVRPIFMDWPDARPRNPGEPAFEHSVLGWQLCVRIAQLMRLR
jgi:LmbE family N-acetylglucosaminyl deacetylase